MDNRDLYYNEMPFINIQDKRRLKNYEDKLVMIKSKLGFTHLFRLRECNPKYITGIMYTGKQFEPVKIPLNNIECFYATKLDYNNLK
ncbi:hypothetical protein SH1V18_23850 [Vallitalea longa]|uniref:Uncharacterized protein n=1 Tax=Vallitalea longa TaxID=2936439 RepID=A0A9W5Y9Q7_9FIRM|nr:hypothetical protein [Vallitalea longa]GKX29905.1 hypothetical protein SH1V18_23850 [Vallitalea longa]